MPAHLPSSLVCGRVAAGWLAGWPSTSRQACRPGTCCSHTRQPLRTLAGKLRPNASTESVAPSRRIITSWAIRKLHTLLSLCLPCWLTSPPACLCRCLDGYLRGLVELRWKQIHMPPGSSHGLVPYCRCPGKQKALTVTYRQGFQGLSGGVPGQCGQCEAAPMRPRCIPTGLLSSLVPLQLRPRPSATAALPAEPTSTALATFGKL